MGIFWGGRGEAGTSWIELTFHLNTTIRAVARAKYLEDEAKIFRSLFLGKIHPRREGEMNVLVGTWGQCPSGSRRFTECIFIDCQFYRMKFTDQLIHQYDFTEWSVLLRVGVLQLLRFKYLAALQHLRFNFRITVSLFHSFIRKFNFAFLQEYIWLKMMCRLLIELSP